RIVSFPYDMAKLIPALETRQPIPTLPEEPSWVLFVKSRSRLEIKTFVISSLLNDVLERCHGQTTLYELLATLAPPPGSLPDATAEETKAACRAILAQLYQEGAINFIA